LSAPSRDRSETLAATPQLADALADGAITAGHVDALTRSSKQLNDEQRVALFNRVDQLTDVAAAARVDEFSKRVRTEAKILQTDDGIDRLERQRASVRLSTWTDAEGMWNVHGQSDPVTGVRIASKLENAVNSLFAESVPDLCPSDPVEKQKFLAGHALDRLVGGPSAKNQTRVKVQLKRASRRQVSRVTVVRSAVDRVDLSTSWSLTPMLPM
jgi:hypothetical protein